VNRPVPGVLRRFGKRLPVTDRTPMLSLGEGDTPLYPSPRMAEWIGIETLHLKFEGANPTGSFKDRGMVVAVAKAIEDGARAVLCASTGNTAASAAAYAAHAGITAVTLLPGGRVAGGKVAQAVMYGARVAAMEVNFDRALDVARVAADRYPLALVNSVNPHRIAGQTTAAYEIVAALGDAPDVVALPVGNGGNITAYWLGFCRDREAANAARLPRMLGVQADGASPLVRGAPVEDPETVATAIRIGRPATWEPAIAAARDSGGQLRAVSDDEILEAWRQVARLEGVFCEPASAAGLAGLRRAVSDGTVAPDESCVAILTGNGLKDPETALSQATAALQTIEPSADALAAFLGL
jgi:threonine synthase